MMKITSAHSNSSGEIGVAAAGSVPADATSNPSRFEKTCCAVGLRRRFWVQTKRTRFTTGAAAQLSPVGTIPAVSTIRMTVFSGARGRCIAPFGTTNA